MREILPSVGIDIGTSTTQVIFSKLEIDNTSGFGAIPKNRNSIKKRLFMKVLFIQHL